MEDQQELYEEIREALDDVGYALPVPTISETRSSWLLDAVRSLLGAGSTERPTHSTRY